MAAGLEARGGAREQWACAASITVPGPADLPFRSGEAAYQPHQASALSSRRPWKEFALQTVALCGGTLLGGTTAAF